MKVQQTAAAIAVVAVIFASPSQAQEAQTAKPPVLETRKPGPTLMVEVTVNRYQGEKRLSSIPYTLTVLPDQTESRLRVGGEIPVPSTTISTKEGDARPITSYSYRNIGTNIDVTARPAPEGGYRLMVTLEESSVYPPSETKGDSMVAGVPAFRRAASTNNLNLRDGQSLDFTAATDRISGEVTRISVKLTVLK